MGQRAAWLERGEAEEGGCEGRWDWEGEGGENEDCMEV